MTIEGISLNNNLSVSGKAIHSHITSIYLDQVSTDRPESSNDVNEVVVATRMKVVLQLLAQIGRERFFVVVCESVTNLLQII